MKKRQIERPELIDYISLGVKIGQYPEQSGIKRRIHQNICSMVAVSMALGISFDEAYDKLADTGKKYQIIMNHAYCVGALLKKNGFVPRYLLYEENRDSLPTLGEFILSSLEDKDFSGGYVVGIPDHVVYVEGLIVYEMHNPIDEGTDGFSRYIKCMLNKPIRYWFKRPIRPILTRYNAELEDFYFATLFGEIPCIFTDLRIDKRTIPRQLKMYEIRHDDDSNGDPVQIAIGDNFGIRVNYYGCIITPKRLVGGEIGGVDGYMDIDPDDLDIHWSDKPLTLQEFRTNCRRGLYSDLRSDTNINSEEEEI